MQISGKIFPTYAYLILALFSCILAPTLPQAQENSIEYKVKAAFLLNFVKFMSWQETSNEDDFFRVCLLGKNTFANTLLTLERKSVRGKKVKVLFHKNMKDIQLCKVVFISHSELQNIKEILKSLEGRQVVTVSDIDNFAEKGGMIEFIQLQGRISFIINLEELSHEGISVKASLLNLAQAVINNGR